MSCACIKRTMLDILVTSNIEGNMVVVDKSVWIDNLKPSCGDTCSTLSIECTSGEEKANMIYNPVGANIVSDLEDGLYKIRVYNCGFDHIVYRAFLPELKQKFEDLLKSYGRVDTELLSEIYLQFSLIDVLSENKEIEKAQYYIDTLTERLNTLHCDTC